MSTPEAALAAGPAHPAEHKDYQGAKIGMWLFLFTELVLFGGMFIAYSAYRGMHPDAFHKAAGELNVTLGVTNTVVLLTSSLTMALSISAIQRGRKRHSQLFLGTTLTLGLVFLVIKYLEWTAKIAHG
ncbi:MAG: cytochrome c oxidase subunit 3, partial [Myxococcaceae bacterium]